MPLYRELWLVCGTKLSKRAKKMLKTTLVLEDQSRKQMIKMWKWCELWLRKTAEWVSGWLQDRQLITPARKMYWSDFENGSSESERTLQTTGCCTTITRQLTLRFQIRKFLAKKNIPVLPYPPYSPDLAPWDFYLFSKLKLKLKGHNFRTMENITDELHALTENDFRYCYDQWKKRWNHCVTSRGSHFEGDNL